MVSNSAELRSFLLTMCIQVPESTTNSVSSSDPLWSSHQKFLLWAPLYQCVFCQKPFCNFGSLADLAIFVLRGCDYKFCACPKPDTTFARGSEADSREELEASRCSGKLPSTRRAWTPVAILADHAPSFLVLPRWRHFCLGCRLLLVHATSFPVLPHSKSHFVLMLDAPWESRFPAMM